MTKEFSSIVELKSIREQKSRLSEREQELSSPILTDFSLIPEIYECSERYFPGQIVRPILKVLPSERSSSLSCCSCSPLVCLPADGYRTVSGQKFPACSRMFPRV